MKTQIVRFVVSVLFTMIAMVTMGTRACDVWVDLDSRTYELGAKGQTTLYNDSSHTLFLSGCSQFGLEQRVAGNWIDRGPHLQCVWEGIAIPLVAGDFFASTFDVPDQLGIWRLVFKVNWGCQEGLALSVAHCSGQETLFSPEFEITAQTAPDCADKAGIDFGACEMLLGWAVRDGACEPVSGCNSKGFAFFGSQQECLDRC